MEGQLLAWLEQKAGALAIEEKQESARAETARARAGVGPDAPKGRARKAQGPHRAPLTSCMARRPRTRRGSRVYIPPGPRLGDRGHPGRGRDEGLRRRLLFEGLTFELPPGGIVGVIGPNGAGKTTLFRMIVGDEKPDAGP